VQLPRILIGVVWSAERLLLIINKCLIVEIPKPNGYLLSVDGACGINEEAFHASVCKSRLLELESKVIFSSYHYARLFLGLGRKRKNRFFTASSGLRASAGVSSLVNVTTQSCMK